MEKRSIQRGRPAGTKTFDAVPAKAFGAAVAALRTEDGIAQETLALMTGIERSHMGKIERGLHAPTLVLILRIAKAMGRSAGELMLETEARLPSSWEDAGSASAAPAKSKNSAE
ncbi:helix-turn-helix transcriptional regulator [Pelomonas aquatica]|jgi:transcriptional regulator with XRE-family HTH domain|uniref:XRE family transcriptional regulator n=1 Tax=Pelomonas aquatica TaxID=431058 RepID=A0A9X4LDG7_9BURK|nr:helix-turn-helix transcriptional regulator [Pelomonas aquatica]MCY4754437.1 helix-turn-helix transcriptional regulator [Pelomonas aquatica]MDG0861515.1 XRE family transcriptional regulator [Pelomonas aquatica]